MPPYTPRSLRVPEPVRPGDRLGVAALSGPVSAERLERGLDTIRGLGFEPVLAENLLQREGLHAGRDAARLAGLHDLLNDGSVRGIVFARGGHGVLSLLPHIDWDLIARRRIALVGYSDLTPLLLRVVQGCDLVTFHGPMVATEMAHEPSASETDRWVEILGGGLDQKYEIRGLRGGRAEGQLLGGCLSMIVATAGTPFFPEFERSLLFLEDIGEATYRWDRMLTQLRLSGSLDGAEGLLLGHFSAGNGPQPDDPEWREWVERVASEVPFPVADGLCCGHGRPNLMLPLGVPALLDTHSQTLSTLRPG